MVDKQVILVKIAVVVVGVAVAEVGDANPWHCQSRFDVFEIRRSSQESTLKGI